MLNSESKRELLQQQRMPVLDWQYEGFTTQSVADKYLPLPQVMCWEEFDEIQHEFLVSMESEYTTSPLVGIRNCFPQNYKIKTEPDVMLCCHPFINAVLELLQLKYEAVAGYTCSRQIEDKSNRLLQSRDFIELAVPLTYTLDLLYSRKNEEQIERAEPVVVVELKRASFFRANSDGVLPDLVATDNFHASTRQLYTYMSCTETGYGLLTSGDASFFFKRETTDNGVSVLKIAKGFLWEDLIVPMAAFYHTAFCDMTKYKEAPERSDGLTLSDREIEETESSPEEDDKTDGPHKPPGNSKKPRLFHMETRSTASTSEKNSSDMNVINSSFSINTKPFASGSCGNIFVGKVNGRKVAVKFTLCETAVAKTLQNEIIMYGKLKAYWGQCVPALLSYGTLAEGRVLYLATEFIESLELGKEVVTSTVVEAAVTALQIIHSCSILHGDISKHNILVADHGHGGVYFIDFGFSELTSNKKELQREIAELNYLLESLMASGKGKANRLDDHITQSTIRT